MDEMGEKLRKFKIKGWWMVAREIELWRKILREAYAQQDFNAADESIKQSLNTMKLLYPGSHLL